MNNAMDISYDDEMAPGVIVVSPVEPATSDVAHVEPKLGGSYTRNLETGELQKTAQAPVDQPDQE